MIELQGEDKIGQGILIGGGVGAALGVAIGLSSGDDPPSKGWFTFRYKAEDKALIYGCGLGLVGALIGLIAGANSSTYDKVVYEYSIPENYDYTKLNIFSRYPGKEPEYLKAID